MTVNTYYAKGKQAYDDGERWLSNCPYAYGSWQREAWCAGFWARRSECLSGESIVRGV